MKISDTLKRLIAMTAVVIMLLGTAWPKEVIAATYNATIIVKQTFTERDAPEGKVFKYKLTPVGTAPVDGFTVSGTGVTAGSISVGAYEFAIDGTSDCQLIYTGLSEGEYHYTLECVPDDRTALRYVFDSAKYEIILYAKGDGTDATVNIKDANGNKPAEAKFIHSYGDADPFIMIDPPVRKRVEGNPPEDAEFKFRLRAVENTAGIEVKKMPMPEGSANGEKSLTVIGAGEEEFGWWTYTKAGIYTYDICEVDMGDPDYKYDTKMFTLTDEVTRVDGSFNVTRTITDSNGKVVQNTLVRTSGEQSSVKLDYVNKYIGDDGDKDKDKDDGSKEGLGKRIIRRVKTGDMTVIMPWAFAFAIALMLVIWTRRRKERQK